MFASTDIRYRSVEPRPGKKVCWSEVGFKIDYDCSFIINFDPSGIDLRLCKVRHRLLEVHQHLLEGRLHRGASPGQLAKVWDGSGTRKTQPGGREDPEGGGS